MGRYDGFDQFVAAQGAALSRTAFLLTGDRGHAEDLLQDALAKAAQRWRGLADDGNPSAYVRQVMLNGSRSLWRRRKRGIEHPLAVLPEIPSHADTARDVTNVAALGDALRKLGRASVLSCICVTTKTCPRPRRRERWGVRSARSNDKPMTHSVGCVSLRPISRRPSSRARSTNERRPEKRLPRARGLDPQLR